MATIYMDFYKELMEKDIFTNEQRNEITKTFLKHKKNYSEKIRRGCLLGTNVGRPKVVKNMENFNVLGTLYKQGACRLETMLKILNLKKPTFFRYLKEYYQPVSLKQTLKDEKAIKTLKELYDKYAYEYADFWAEKLCMSKYEDDFKQDCLVQMYANLFNYDGTVNFKLFCFSICERILNEYINRIRDERKICSYDKPWNEKGESIMGRKM